MRPVLLALAVGAALAPAARGGDLRNFDDAALHAVQFIDRDEGWAVGDEGVVWHTLDSGRNWERQPTGVRASLRGLHFLSPFVGWVAGREELPHGGGSVGVLLYTSDGGVKWHRLLTNALPGLHQVHFASAREGFALGDGSDQFPTGLFRTTDGGRTWQPVKGPRCPGWLAAAFQDGQNGALVGAWGRLAKFRKETIGTAEVEALGGRTLSGVQMIANRAFAVGQGGAVLFSTTSGARWGYADLKLPADVLAGLDFHGIHWAGDQVWVVGRPGSVLLHSADGGGSWKLVKTGQPLPLHGVYFLDENRGWAVGELGSILGTTDGGRTWKVQRRGGRRVAVLFVHADAAGVPVDTAAILGGEEGYLTAALQVVGPDPGSAAFGHAAAGQRLAAAFRRAGGASAEVLWQFPRPEHAAHVGKEGLLDGWNRLHGSRADRELLRQLVLALRMWRPDVVITDHPDAAVTESPARALVAEALHEALGQAADPKAFPEQVRRLGLEPWRVSKVYAAWHDKQGAEVVLDLTEARARLETAARDFAGPAAALLSERPAEMPEERYYHLVDSRLKDAVNHKHLMDGIHLAPEGFARRKLSEAGALSPEILKSIRTRRTLQRLTGTPAGRLTDPNRTLAELGRALAGMPDDQAAPAAFAIASRYAAQGQWTLAREAYLLMVDRYPAHPLSADAYRWLIRHNTSSEARRRQELGQFLLVGRPEFEVPSVGPADGLANLSAIKERRRLVYLGNRDETRQWDRGSQDIGDRLAAFGPLYAGDPAIQFCLHAARRRLGEVGATQHWYQLFMEQQAEGPWHDAAAAELWLANRTGTAPKPVAWCRKASVRPLLDGNFDDACWQGHQAMVLRNAAGETAKDYPTQAWLAYDQDFLYLALRCRHPAGKQVPPVKVRKRDENLRAYDRVSLILDLDRDYSTYYRFQVDQRGCVCEDCWGDRSWDPRWFVAVRSDQTGWQIEAAIPMGELLGDRVLPGTAWAFNVVRVLPGRGVQAWSAPADAEPRPEGLGLLLFGQDEAPVLAGPKP
jgi:photosystem II stability/assembly factor-like uncharacterized protein